MQTRIKKNLLINTETPLNKQSFRTILYHRQSFLNLVPHTVTSAAANFKTTWFMQTTISETEI